MAEGGDLGVSKGGGHRSGATRPNSRTLRPARPPRPAPSATAGRNQARL